MKAVVLAGGRGTRFGNVTRNTPKSLITVRRKELICHVLDALPKSISECVIVLGYLGEQIQERLGNTYGTIALSYVFQKRDGTGGALQAAQDVLEGSERFMVVGSDDIFGRHELTKLVAVPASYGVFFGVSNKAADTQVLFDDQFRFRGFGVISDPLVPRYFGTGSYVLHGSIFNESFAELPNGELSIPHTLVHCRFPITVVPIVNWLPVNNEHERQIAEKAIDSIDQC